jgi:hypothetical protein
LKSWQPRLEDRKSRKINRDKFFSSSQDRTQKEAPAEVKDWLNNLGLLYGVPFYYSVPDERMLPEESIRFFYIDKNWIKSLQDGACSIVGCSQKDLHLEENSTLTGFLLRSILVEAWPGLKVIGIDKNKKELNKRRMEYLTSSILLCIFEGELSCLRIQKPAESLHLEICKEDCITRNGKVIDIEKLSKEKSLSNSLDFAQKYIKMGEEVIFKIEDN